ncbi:MAG: cysteine desulfurase [Candidatus Pacebacteria bacterium]|nr:cysteine desulfurase [Candidatus Paceibacterota bacterium]
MKFWKLGKRKRIYADAAAATPLSLGVQKEMSRLQALYGNPGGLHKDAVAAKKELERARARVAKAIGAHPDEIFFTSGGTESNNLAILGALRPLLREQGELSAVTTSIEHLSVLEPLRILEHDGLYTTELKVSESGEVSTKDLRETINDETVLVSVQMINSEIGTIQNIREIAKEIRHVRKLRKEAPLYFHSDASQAPLWLPLNVEKLGVDLLTLDAQKMMGPKGASVLYIKRDIDVEPILWGGGQERGLRSGTENVVMAGALAQALEEAQAGVDARVAHVTALRDNLITEIQKRIPNAELNGVAGDSRVANNINISISGLDAQMAVIALDAEGVAASTRSACSGADEEPSYVIKALGKSDIAAKSSIRITLLPDASSTDIRRITEALVAITTRYSQKSNNVVK